MKEADIFKILNEANIETWYDELKDHTMKTFFFPITKEIASAIVNTYLDSKGESIQTENDKKTLERLQKDIDDFLVNLKNAEKSAFIRLSTRSPKDSRKARSKSESFFEQESEKGFEDENARLIALVKASIQGLKIQTGKEAIELLTDSERVYDDLLTALEHLVKYPKEFTQKIIIREWIDIPIDMEFRGFVHDKALNALSQYYHYCFFPKLVQELPIIERRIKDFYESIKDSVSLNSFIIDFAVLEDEILIIELNPLFLGTDPCLFSWKTDKKIFEEGPYEFRIRNKLVEKKKI